MGPSFCSCPSPRGCWEAVGFTFPPARIPAGGDLFLTPDICFVESDGAAPSEAQIPAPLPAAGFGVPAGPGSITAGWPCSTGLAAVDPWACPLASPFLSALALPSAAPSPKLPATPALPAILLATKLGGLAASSSRGFSQSYLVRASQGRQWPPWLDRGYGESRDMQLVPS